MPLIRLILSLAHYPRNEQENLSGPARMGFDPTLAPIIDANGNAVKDCHGFPQYRFDMKSLDTQQTHTYETVEAIANHKSIDFLGPATRV